MFEINIVKKVLIHIRTSIKIIALFAIAAIMISGLVAFAYKPIYSVTFQGQHIGYSENKSELQKKINEYMETGEGEYIAFVDIPELPQYELCMLKKGIVTNDDEIFEKVKATGVPYYEYYAVTLDGEEKYYVPTAEVAEQAIQQLKDKNSTNKDKLGFIKKYLTELTEFTDVETIVSELYVKPVEKKVVAISTAMNVGGPKIDLGISLTTPVSGIISSRFGGRASGNHTGLDIATSTGTPISAAAGGVVTYSGTRGTYGKLIIISHGNGIETYYAHCNALYAEVGQTVAAGEVIAEVGSTGKSTGPHLHLEIRVNGVAQNPQNYLY